MVKVNLIGFAQFEADVKTSSKRLESLISSEVLAAANEFAKLAKRDAPKDNGQIANGISVESTGILSANVVSAAAHSPYMEFGTKKRFTPIPGVDSSQFRGKGKGDYYDFLNAILDWVKRNGLATIKNSYTGKSRTNKNDLLMVAESIAFSIMRHGVKPHPFFFKQTSIVRERLMNRISSALNSKKIIGK